MDERLWVEAVVLFVEYGGYGLHVGCLFGGLFLPGGGVEYLDHEGTWGGRSASVRELSVSSNSMVPTGL